MNFFLTNDLSLLESCQLYIIAHYKASYCYKIETVIHRWSAKKDVQKHFTKFTGKFVCQSLLFNNVAGLRTATLIKGRLWHRCSPANIAKLLRTPFL